MFLRRNVWTKSREQSRNPTMQSSSQYSSIVSRLAEDGTGIVIAGHGSRNPGGVEQFDRFMKSFQEAASPVPVTYGLLEFASLIEVLELIDAELGGFHLFVAGVLLKPWVLDCLLGRESLVLWA